MAFNSTGFVVAAPDLLSLLKNGGDFGGLGGGRGTGDRTANSPENDHFQEEIRPAFPSSSSPLNIASSFCPPVFPTTRGPHDTRLRLMPDHDRALVRASQQRRRNNTLTGGRTFHFYHRKPPYYTMFTCKSSDLIGRRRSWFRQGAVLRFGQGFGQGAFGVFGPHLFRWGSARGRPGCSFRNFRGGSARWRPGCSFRNFRGGSARGRSGCSRFVLRAARSCRPRRCFLTRLIVIHGSGSRANDENRALRSLSIRSHGTRVDVDHETASASVVVLRGGRSRSSSSSRTTADCCSFVTHREPAVADVLCSYHVLRPVATSVLVVWVFRRRDNAAPHFRTRGPKTWDRRLSTCFLIFPRRVHLPFRFLFFQFHFPLLCCAVHLCVELDDGQSGIIKTDG